MKEQKINIDNKEVLYQEEFKFRLLVEAIHFWLKKDYSFLDITLKKIELNSVSTEDAVNTDFIFTLFSGIEEVSKSGFLNRLQQRDVLKNPKSGWEVLAKNTIREKMKRGSLDFAITEGTREGYNIQALAEKRQKNRSFPIWDDKEVIKIFEKEGKNKRSLVKGIPYLFPKTEDGFEIIDIGELYHRQLQKVESQFEKKWLENFSKNNTRAFTAIQNGELDGFVLETYLKLKRKSNFIIYNEKAENWFPIPNKKKPIESGRKGKTAWANYPLPVTKILTSNKGNIEPNQGEYFALSRAKGKIALFRDEEGTPKLIRVVNMASVIKFESKNKINWSNYKHPKEVEFIFR